MHDIYAIFDMRCLKKFLNNTKSKHPYKSQLFNNNFKIIKRAMDNMMDLACSLEDVLTIDHQQIFYEDNDYYPGHNGLSLEKIR